MFLCQDVLARIERLAIVNALPSLPGVVINGRLGRQGLPACRSLTCLCTHAQTPML